MRAAPHLPRQLETPCAYAARRAPRPMHACPPPTAGVLAELARYGVQS